MFCRFFCVLRLNSWILKYLFFKEIYYEGNPDLNSNIFKSRPLKWEMYKYRVTFEPDVQSKLLKQDLIRQHDYLFYNSKAFDGVDLYVSSKLKNDVIFFFNIIILVDLDIKYWDFRILYLEITSSCIFWVLENEGYGALKWVCSLGYYRARCLVLKKFEILNSHHIKFTDF